MSHSNYRVCVVGLGKLGLPLVATLASRGYLVTGYDHDKNKIKEINRGRLPIESGLPKLIARHRSKITFTNDFKSATDASLIFIVVPTSSLPNGSFSTKHVISVAEKIGAMLQRVNSFRTIAVVSTVLPNDMAHIQKIIEKTSGKKCGLNFGLCYTPAFIALGSVIRDLLHPDFILIGESDRRSGLILKSFYRRFCAPKTKIHQMSFSSAELSKVAVNAFVTMKISFANTLARLAEKLPGADAAVIARAIKNDRRIGPHFPAGGFSYGGPCFPRDNKAFAFAAKKLGVHSHLAVMTDKTNHEQCSLIKKLILSIARPSDRIGILGLSYKPDTDILEDSPAMTLVKSMPRRKKTMILYDPAALQNAKKILKNKVTYAASLRQCVRRSDVIVVATPWKEFQKIRNEDLLSKKIKTIIDGWRIFEGRQFPKNVRYLPLGSGLAAHDL